MFNSNKDKPKPLNTMVITQALQLMGAADEAALPLTNITNKLEKNNDNIQHTLVMIEAEMNKLEMAKQDLLSTVANNNRVIAGLKGIFSTVPESSEVD